MNAGQTQGEFFFSFGRGGELLGMRGGFVFGSRDVVVTPTLECCGFPPVGVPSAPVGASGLLACCPVGIQPPRRQWGPAFDADLRSAAGWLALVPTCCR
jgi:hypothetical protein